MAALAISMAAWVAIQLLTSAWTARLALDVGGAVRAWLMRRMVRLDAGRLRHAGIGDLLGRVLEAESLDALAMGGGAQALSGVFELGAGIVVMQLAAAASRVPLAGAGVALGLGALAAFHYAGRFSTWVDRHRDLTSDLVERMCGHATVLVQDCAATRVERDAVAVGRYAADARHVDGAEAIATVVLPRLWLLGMLAALAWSSLREGAANGGGGTAATLVGGIWLFHSGLRRLAEALPALVAVRHAWRRMAALLASSEDQAELPAARAMPPPSEGSDGYLAASGGITSPDGGSAGGDEPRPALLAAIGLGFRYPEPGTSAVFRGLDLSIHGGERVLLEGPSGQGKSTLAALLCGLKTPTTGSLRLDGVSQSEVGLAAWRRRVGAVPQFHDNHILSATLAFNLLMGRRWPPRREDMRAAHEVCRRLDLGPLLARMPAGLHQQIGETGWQLSHGERSRIFLARSLLQELDVRILDETFSALDATTLDEVMRFVLEQPAALMLIAHP